jgi:hypothetical protein
MLHAALTDLAQALRAIADAQARIAATPKLTLELRIAGGGNTADAMRRVRPATEDLIAELRRRGLV